MLESALRNSASAVLLNVVVVPGAARTETDDVDPWRHALKVRVAARAEGGAANDALVRFLADRLELPRSSVQIVRGQTSRYKTVALRGIDREEALHRLGGGP